MTEGRRIIFIVALLFISFGAFAQKTKTQLQKEKEENLRKIRETEKILEETGQQKQNSLGELIALNQRINQQESLIRSIQSEIHVLDSDIDQKSEIIGSLEEDLKQLRKEYATMLQSAQRASGKVDKLLFLFSAESFDQMLMRLKYMEQYSAARKDQAEVIQRVQKVLADQVTETQEIKKEKNSLLGDQIKQNNQLTSLKQKQNTLVKKLEKEEKRLKSEIEDTRKAVAKLDKLISDIIKEEMERAAREARAANSAKTAEAAVKLSANFEGNKAKFPWPASGIISQKFGRQNHPVLKRIILQNDGINIQTKQNEKVKAIFDGEVRAVAFIPSIGNSVIISHGDYFTVYSGLKDVSVNKGQKVNTNQEIGQVLTNAEGISELRFQIRKNTTPVDPEQWLKN
ncbi:MAG: murein hydrolase activator EnvC [Cyclobacteriaceae bacterium]